MKQIPKLVHIILAISASFSGYAQTARVFNSDTGLPSTRINSVIQDNDGFVWAATDDGLARYDGTDFVTFHHDDAKPSSLASDLTLSILQDSRGVMWVGSSMGLQTFDPETNSFEIIDLQDPELPNFSQYVYGLMEIPYGSRRSDILVSASQHGLYVVDSETHRLDSSKRAKLMEAAGSEFINRLFLDSKGNIWLGSEMGGLAVVDKSTLSVTRDIWDSGDSDMAAGVQVTSFAEDNATETVIIGTSNYGILIYSHSTGKIRRASSPEARECKAMSILNEGFFRRAGESSFYVGTENNGLFTFSLDGETLHRTRIPTIPQDISNWKIHGMISDNQGNIWISAYQTGLMVVPNSMFGFLYFDLNGTRSACVTSITSRDEAWDFWVGTDGSGLYHVEGRGEFTNFNMDNSSLPNNSIMSTAFDKRGALWIATFLDGLVKYTPESGFQRFQDQASIGSDRTFCLAYDGDSDLLYVGTHGNGLSIVDAASGKVIRTISEDLNKWISTLYIDSSGTVWVGTFNGPMCYDPESMRLFSYNLGTALSSSRVYAFAEGSDGTMWLGTGNGLVEFKRTDKSVRIYTEADGLSGNTIDGILEGDDKTIWISTSSGLSRLNPKDGSISRFYAYDGLQGNEFRYNASYKGRNGRLYFGGTGGLTAFHPHVIGQKVHDVPQIQFTRLTVANKDVQPDTLSKTPVLDKNIMKALEIVLPYSSNSFSLEYAVPEYTNPQRLRFSYRLSKFDKEWNHATPSDKNVLTYTNIPFGRHTLTINAFFDGDEEHCSSRSIVVRVLPPAALSWWALLLYGLFSACFCWLIIELVGRNRREALEEKASEAQRMRLEMFNDISEEIRNPLTLVMSPLKELRENEDDPKKKDLYNLIYRNSLRILRLVNQVTDIRKADNGQMDLHFVETDIVYMIGDVMHSFDNISEKQGIKYTLEAEDGVPKVWVDHVSFDKIVFNLLSNAFRHTGEKGEVSVRMSAPKPNDGALASGIDSYIDISVFNTGRHIAESDIDKVFDRFFKSDGHDAGAGTGIGLNLAKTLVDLHHGSINAANTGDGVTLTVSLPVGKAHLSARETAPTLIANSPYDRPKEVRRMVNVFGEKSDEEAPKDLKSKKNVVLIDSNEDMLGYIRSELQDTFNVKVMTNARDAWPVISTTIPDAVVSDLMAGGDNEGARLCHKVKHEPGTNHIPFIILTAQNDEESARRCIESGADRVFVKPISMSLLKSGLSQTISTRETIRNKFSSEMEYNYDDVKIASTGSQLLSKVIQAIKDHIADPDFGVEELSREIGMSRVHMNRKLKESINISPSSLIKSIRLKQAAYLLINNNVNISEVAYRVGFSTHSYFSSSFHEYFGLTPKEFVAKYSDSRNEEELKKLFEI